MTMDFNPARFVDRLQQAWQQRDWHDLAEMYHPEAVLLPPDLGETLVGRDSILQTYREFDDQARLHAFRITRVQAYEFRACCVVHCGFEADYSIKDWRSLDSGTEIYLVEPGSDGRWLIVWRQQIIDSARSPNP